MPSAKENVFCCDSIFGNGCRYQAANIAIDRNQGTSLKSPRPLAFDPTGATSARRRLNIAARPACHPDRSRVVSCFCNTRGTTRHPGPLNRRQRTDREGASRGGRVGGRGGKTFATKVKGEKREESLVGECSTAKKKVGSLSRFFLPLCLWEATSHRASIGHPTSWPPPRHVCY